jgi:hypothetical protein
MGGWYGGSIHNRSGNGAAQASQQGFVRGGCLRFDMSLLRAGPINLNEGIQDEIQSS